MSDILGQLCWYTLTTGRSGAASLDVTPEQLEAWFDELGLDRTFLPKQTRSVDAFKVATSTRTGEYVSDDGHRYKLRVVESKQGVDKEVIKRHVLREAVSDSDHSTARVANITFYRPRRRTVGRVHGSEDVKYQLHVGLGGVDKKEVRAFVHACLAEYETARRSLSPHRMRGLLRDYLTFKGAVAIKDGLYFVPPAAGEVAQGLKVLTARMGPKCRMMLVPLVDGDEQREMLREAIDDDVDDRARVVLEKIAKWLETHPNRVPTPGVMRGWRDEYRGLQELVAGYAEEWDVAFPAAADALEELQRAVDQMSVRFVQHQMWR